MAILEENYWDNQFVVTTADLDRVADSMRRDSKPVDLTSLANQLVINRLEHGQEPSPSVLKEWTGKESVRLWDPAGEWAVGEGVIVVRSVDTDIYDAFVGEITEIEGVNNKKIVAVRLDGTNTLVRYECAPPGSLNASLWRRKVIDVVEEKYASKQIEDQATGIILKFGNRIVSHLQNGLAADERFITLEGSWFLRELLPSISTDEVDAIYKKLLTTPSISDVGKLVDLNNNTGTISLAQKMAIHVTLTEDTVRFKNEGTKSRPKWKAVLPVPEQAIIIRYAYDPETYYIICRPGEAPKPWQVQRLQQLGLYQHVVAFAK